MLSTVLLGVLVSVVTQLFKKIFPTVSPLFWVAILALIGGFAYSFIIPMVPQEIIEKSISGFAYAVGIYETLIAFMKAPIKK